MSGPPSARTGSKADFRNRQEDYVNKLNIYQKQVAEFEQFEKDLADAQKTVTDWKRKAQAHRARVQVFI